MSTSKSFASRAGWMGLGAVLALGFGMTIGHVGAADEKPAAAPAAPVKLVKPWSDLTSLKDEQKVKINEIHQKSLALQNEAKRQEKADIMAILDDKQKAELKELAAKENKDEAAKRAAKKAGATGPATAPAEKKG